VGKGGAHDGARSLSDYWVAVASMGLAGRGRVERRSRCGPSATTNDKGIDPQPPCSLRVTGGVGRSALLPLLEDGPRRLRRGRLAAGPTAPVTQSEPLLGQAPRVDSESIADDVTTGRESGILPLSRRDPTGGSVDQWVGSRASRRKREIWRVRSGFGRDGHGFCGG